MQLRNYILTINNPKKNDEELKEYIEKLEHLKYCVFQKEKGEKAPKKVQNHDKTNVEFNDMIEHIVSSITSSKSPFATSITSSITPPLSDSEHEQSE